MYCTGIFSQFQQGLYINAVTAHTHTSLALRDQRYSQTWKPVKLSRVESGQYLDGRLSGKTGAGGGVCEARRGS